MNWLEIAVSFAMVLVGVITYALRNTPNPYVGVRMGYTYLSKEAWRKANTFAGIYCVAVGFALLALSVIFQPPNLVFLSILLTSVAILAVLSYRIAKETYEMEDLKAPIKSAKPLEKIDVKPYLLVQLISVILYLILVSTLWDEIPSKFAVHFNVSGKPDCYADKVVGAVILPLLTMSIVPAVTVLSSKEPFSTKGRKPSFEFLVGLQLFIVMAMVFVLLYNVGWVCGELIMWSVTVSVVFLIIWVAWLWSKSRGRNI